MQTNPPMTLRRAIDGYLGDLVIGNRSKDGILERKRLLDSMVEYAPHSLWPEEVGDIDSHHIRSFIKSIKNAPDKRRRGPDSKPTGDVYYNSQFTRLDAFFNWAVKNTNLETNPMDVLPAPKVIETIIPILSPQEITSLFEVIDAGKQGSSRDKFLAYRDHAALSLLVDTPIRRGELVGLSPEHLDLKERQVKVLGKGGKERHMWYGERTADALREYLARRRFRKPAPTALWVGFHGSPSGDGWIRKFLEEAGEKAGVSGVHPHRFRHTWTIRAIEMDINERVICRLAGWTKLPYTYIATLGDRQAKAAQMKISPMDRMNDTGTEREFEELMRRLVQHLDLSSSEKDDELMASLMGLMARRQSSPD